MEKLLILISLLFVSVTSFCYSHSHVSTHSSHNSFHSTPHPSYHPHSSTRSYHSYSHGINNYSKPRSYYYSHPIYYFPANHYYYNHYHHYHVGSKKDTVFCENAQHKEPVMESELSRNDIIIIICISIAIFVCIVWVSYLSVYN